MTKLTEREELLTLISDLYKDVYGCRPRGIFSDCTVEELRAEFDSLCESNERKMAEDAQMEAEAAEEFEKRVSETIAMGAGDRETALRWIFEADDLMEVVGIYGGTYATYSLGLPYHYFEAEFPSYPKAA